MRSRRRRRAGSADGGAGERASAPTRLGDVLNASLDRLATSEQARAYAAWARASGEQVASGARPRAFARGLLTVECTSSVWANELTYLGGRILRRMDELTPGHPVKRFRFVVERAAASQDEVDPAAESEVARERSAPPDLGGARRQAEGVHDERLRAAIEAVLRTSTAGPSESPDDEPLPR